MSEHMGSQGVQSPGGFLGAKSGGDVRSREGAQHHLPFMCPQWARPAPRSEVQIIGRTRFPPPSHCLRS